MYPILFYTLENFSTKNVYVHQNRIYVLLCCFFFMLQSLQSVFLVFTVKHACMKRVSEDCLVKSKLYIYCRALNKQRSNNGFFQGHSKDLIRVLVTNHDFKNQVVC